MKFILGKKIEMTQKFKDDGQVVPVTMIEAGPCFITQIKTKDKDGYWAVQIGFGRKKINKPLSGHLKDLGNFRYLREFILEDKEIEKNKNDKITVADFVLGDLVEVIGISKGKGFQGVVKRHHFAGSMATHGHKDQLRMPGSIGSTAPQRVYRGMRMAGRMGGERVTVKNLEVVEINSEKNLIYLKGAVPGGRGSLLSIRSIKKQIKK